MNKLFLRHFGAVSAPGVEIVLAQFFKAGTRPKERFALDFKLNTSSKFELSWSICLKMANFLIMNFPISFFPLDFPVAA